MPINKEQSRPEGQANLSCNWAVHLLLTANEWARRWRIQSDWPAASKICDFDPSKVAFRIQSDVQWWAHNNGAAGLRNMTRTLTAVTLVLLSLTAFAAKTSDIAVTSTISDYDSTGAAYYVQSDGLYGGVYSNGVAGVDNILQASAGWAYLLDTYNSNLSASGGRNGLITLEPGNQQSATATLPSIWSSWGTHLEPIRTITHGVECDLRTIKTGNPLACPVLLRFGPTFGSGHSTYAYRLDMLGTCSAQQCGFTEPETQEPLISCNAQDASGNCNDWSIDSTPPTSQSGGVPTNKVIARLSLINGSGGAGTIQGDFYLTFHIHVTNP